MKFASQNLRNALQIAKCKALIRTQYFYHLQKNATKDNLECMLYSNCQHRFINFVQQLGQNNFENYSFMLAKFDRYFV